MSQDIVDRIDQLVDEQLANEPSHSPFMKGYEQCPHCHRDWHGLKITQAMEDMRAGRKPYTDDYKHADDDSEVLCEGSAFIGPMKAPPRYSGPWANQDSATVTTIDPSLRERVLNNVQQSIAVLLGIPSTVLEMWGLFDEEAM